MLGEWSVERGEREEKTEWVSQLAQLHSRAGKQQCSSCLLGLWGLSHTQGSPNQSNREGDPQTIASGRRTSGDSVTRGTQAAWEACWVPCLWEGPRSRTPDPQRGSERTTQQGVQGSVIL